MKKIIFLVIIINLGILFIGDLAVGQVICPDSANYEVVNGVCVPKKSAIGISDAEAATVVKAFMNWIIGIFGFLAIIGFVISGIWYLTSYGDEERMKQAKNAMIYSIIGVIVGLMGLVIVVAVNEWLGGSSDF